MKSTKIIYVLPLLLLIVSIFALQSADASTTIFSEDFESYASGSNLVGQGGWVLNNPSQQPGPLYITSGAGLGTQVANGYTDPGTGNMSSVVHTFSSALDPQWVTTLSADGYFFSSGPKSHNTSLALVEGTLISFQAGWDYYDNPGESCIGLTFHFSGNTHCSPGFSDEAVNMEIIINGPTNEIYGRLTGSVSGSVETAHWTIADEDISVLDGVRILNDYRYSWTSGAEYDNITVTTSVVPEPISSILFVTGGTLLAGRRFIRRKKA